MKVFTMHCPKSHFDGMHVFSPEEEKIMKKKRKEKNIMRILPFFGGITCLFTVHYALHTLCLFTIQMHNWIVYTFCWDVQLKMAFPQSLCFFLFIFAVHFFQFKLYIAAFFLYSLFTIWNLNRIQVCAWTVSHAIFIFVLSYRTDGFCYGGWLHKTLFSNDLRSVSCLQNRNGIRQTKRRLTFTVQFIRMSYEYTWIFSSSQTDSVSHFSVPNFLYFCKYIFRYEILFLSMEYGIWTLNVLYACIDLRVFAP